MTSNDFEQTKADVLAVIEAETRSLSSIRPKRIVEELDETPQKIGNALAQLKAEGKVEEFDPAVNRTRWKLAEGDGE